MDKVARDKISTTCDEAIKRAYDDYNEACTQARANLWAAKMKAWKAVAHAVRQIEGKEIT